MSVEKIVYEIQKKYSPRTLLILAASVIVIAVILVAGIWGVAYYFSPPGGNVSVLWGLVQHTKGTLTPTTSNRDLEFSSLKQARLFSFESEDHADALYPWLALPENNPSELVTCPDEKRSGGHSACLAAKLEPYDQNRESYVGISLKMKDDESLRSSEFAFVAANVFAKASDQLSSDQLSKVRLKARFFGYRLINGKEEELSGPDTDIIPGKWTLVPWGAAGHVELSGKSAPLAPKSFHSLNLVVWCNGPFRGKIYFDDIQIYVQK